MFNNDPQRVRTGEVRLSYVNLTTPRPPKDNPNGTPKYGAALLIPKTDTTTINDIFSAIRAAADAATNRVWGGFRLPDTKLFSILHDGDGVKDNGKPYDAECKGHWVLNTNSSRKPAVVGIDNVYRELEPSSIYSGMYAQVTVRFYGTDKGGNKICCGLDNVMKTRDGEPLSGGSSAVSDFADIGRGVADSDSQNAAAAPTQGYTPMINPITGLPM